MRKKQQIEINEADKKKLIEDLKNFFLQEREEEIGELFATLLYEFMLQKIGSVCYNQGLHDAILQIHQNVEDLYGLER